MTTFSKQLDCHMDVPVASYIEYIRNLSYERIGFFRGGNLWSEYTSFSKKQVSMPIMSFLCRFELTIHNHPHEEEEWNKYYYYDLFLSLPSIQDLQLFSTNVTLKHIVCTKDRVTLTTLKRQLSYMELNTMYRIYMDILFSAKREDKWINNNFLTNKLKFLQYQYEMKKFGVSVKCLSKF